MKTNKEKRDEPMALRIYEEFMEMAAEIANDWFQTQQEFGYPGDVMSHDEYWGDRFKAYAIKNYNWTMEDDMIRLFFNTWTPKEQRVLDI